MKKIFFFFFTFFLFLNSALSSEKILNALEEGNKLIFIRHSLAPGNGDPENFNINDCSTQRNLSQKGVKQSEKIGQFFNENNVKIGKVLSSEWCRCKDTAKIAFQNFKTFNALNSFYDKKFEKNQSKQLYDFYKYINNWNDGKNLIFVTHYVVISSILGIGTSSGEIVVTDKNFKIIGRLETF